MSSLLDTKEYTVATVLSPTGPPATPALQSPSNGATGVSLPVTLVWQPASGAATYRVQVARDNNFSQLAFDQSGINTTSVSVSGLAANTPYFWRVKAINNLGESNWSTSWIFTTGAETVDIWNSMSAMMALVLVMGMMRNLMPQEGG